MPLPVSDTLTLAGRGRVPSKEDLRVLSSCAVQTPGSGRTVILTLPAAAARHFPAGHVGDVGAGADKKDGTFAATA